MSAVGLFSIALGAVVVCSRGPLLFAPAVTLRWFQRLLETDTRIRIMGVVVAALGSGMVWAGGTASSGLASFLVVAGWCIGAGGSVLLFVFPEFYRSMAHAFLPSDTGADLRGWRMLGGLGVAIGMVLIFLGVSAL